MKQNSLPSMKELISAREISARIAELGKKISADHGSEELICVGVLKGSFVFLADLVRTLDCPVRVEFIGVKSYEGTQSTGHVQITTDLSADIEGKNVLLVEDIIDTGMTIDFLMNTLEVRNPKSLKVCALLSKPDAHIMQHHIDYVGFEIGTEFVVGFGLDLDGTCRNLPYIAEIKAPPPGS